MSSLNLVFTPGAAGGGGFSQSYLGYNTVGGTWETMTAQRVLTKKITLASAGLLADIEAYMRNNGGNVGAVVFALYEDSSGTPAKLLSSIHQITDQIYLDATVGGTSNAGRWFSVPIARWLTAGDYWISVMMADGTASLQIAYDATGSDRYYDSGGFWLTDWGRYTPTTSANSYSMRANLIS